MKLIKSLFRKENPFDNTLEKYAQKGFSKFLIPWNRGLGDVPLGLFALNMQIRKIIPHAEITYITRKDLFDVFSMLEDVDIICSEDWKRGVLFDLEKSLLAHGKSLGEDYDVVLDKIDSDAWLKWQIGKVTPRLKWNFSWDRLAEKFNLEKDQRYIAAHVQSETQGFYGYKKDWPVQSFQDLFNHLEEKSSDKVLLFGMQKTEDFSLNNNVVDLRGETSLFEMISIIKNHCEVLLAPDSGVLSVIYYVDENFPLKIVSFWSDPRQGVLKQNVASPNPSLVHVPLIGHKRLTENIALSSVIREVEKT